MKRTLCVLAVLATTTIPAAQANHGGCVAHSAAPKCTYQAVGPHSWAAATPNAFEIYVFRADKKVVLASRGADPSGVVAGGLTAVGANPGEMCTLEIIPSGGQVLGAVSAGMTSGHP